MLFVIAHADVRTFHEAAVGVKEEARRGAGFRIGSCPLAHHVCETDETIEIGDQ